MTQSIEDIVIAQQIVKQIIPTEDWHIPPINYELWTGDDEPKRIVESAYNSLVNFLQFLSQQTIEARP
jgi:hypothetical protein